MTGGEEAVLTKTFVLLNALFQPLYIIFMHMYIHTYTFFSGPSLPPTGMIAVHNAQTGQETLKRL